MEDAEAKAGGAVAGQLQACEEGSNALTWAGSQSLLSEAGAARCKRIRKAVTKGHGLHVS